MQKRWTFVVLSLCVVSLMGCGLFGGSDSDESDVEAEPQVEEVQTASTATPAQQASTSNNAETVDNTEEGNLITTASGLQYEI